MRQTNGTGRLTDNQRYQKIMDMLDVAEHSDPAIQRIASFLSALVITEREKREEIRARLDGVEPGSQSISLQLPAPVVNLAAADAPPVTVSVHADMGPVAEALAGVFDRLDARQEQRYRALVDALAELAEALRERQVPKEYTIRHDDGSTSTITSNAAGEAEVVDPDRDEIEAMTPPRMTF